MIVRMLKSPHLRCKRTEPVGWPHLGGFQESPAKPQTAVGRRVRSDLLQN